MSNSTDPKDPLYDPNDKYLEYKVDLHTNEEHSNEEVKESDGAINDWHQRHQDKLR